MKVFKRQSAAKKAANGLPIVRIGQGKESVYIVGFRDMVDAKLTEVSLISPGGGITGHVTLSHLDRLGNANHAAAVRPYGSGSAFKES